MRCCGWFGKGVPGGKTGPDRFTWGLPCGSHWSVNYQETPAKDVSDTGSYFNHGLPQAVCAPAIVIFHRFPVCVSFNVIEINNEKDYSESAGLRAPPTYLMCHPKLALPSPSDQHLLKMLCICGGMAQNFMFALSRNGKESFKKFLDPDLDQNPSQNLITCHLGRAYL